MLCFSRARARCKFGWRADRRQLPRAPGGGRDGNSIELLEMPEASSPYLTPAGASKITGGSGPSFVDFHIELHGERNRLAARGVADICARR
jgi:hypothetical protein